MLLLTVSFNCSAGMKSCLKKMFCCCIRQPKENEFSITLPTDESLQFLDVVGADDLAITRVAVNGLTDDQLDSENVMAVLLERVSKALQDEQTD